MRAQVIVAAMAVVGMFVLAATTGCDQLNRPLPNTGGSSSSSSGSPPLAGDDGGAPPDAAMPAFTAQPGDVQL